MFIFFFKQKTAYEMRISDWSSDVCSSDLKGNEALSNQKRSNACRQSAQDCSEMTNIMAEQQESTREPGIDRQRVAGEVEEQREHIKASNGPEDEKNGHKRPLSGRARHHLLSAICGARIARQGTGRTR